MNGGFTDKPVQELLETILKELQAIHALIEPHMEKSQTPGEQYEAIKILVKPKLDADAFAQQIADAINDAGAY